MKIFKTLPGDMTVKQTILQGIILIICGIIGAALLMLWLKINVPK